MRIDKKTILPVVGIFVVFFAVSFTIYFSGRRLHSEGEGLAESVGKIYIVQHFVRVQDGTRVDAKAAAPAARALVNQKMTTTLRLRNLSTVTMRVGIEARFLPDNGDKISILKDEFSVQELSAGETREVSIPYMLMADDLNTRDGTLDLEIKVSDLP